MKNSFRYMLTRYSKDKRPLVGQFNIVAGCATGQQENRMACRQICRQENRQAWPSGWKAGKPSRSHHHEEVLSLDSHSRRLPSRMSILVPLLNDRIAHQHVYLLYFSALFWSLFPPSFSLSLSLTWFSSQGPHTWKRNKKRTQSAGLKLIPYTYWYLNN